MQGFTNVDEGKLITNLSNYTAILSFSFWLPTPVTLAAAVISAITSSPSDRDIITAVCCNGEDYLQSLFYMMDDNPEYDAFKVQIPFLKFVDEDFRIVQGDGNILAIQIDGVWIS